MKRFLSLLLILVCITGIAAAEESLKPLSVDQLRQMIQMINAEIVSRPEWKETEVPVGFWVVGKDIPAGEYSISYSGKSSYLTIENPTGMFSSTLISQGIMSEKSNIGRITLKEGYTVEVKVGPVIFAPPISLGF